MKYPEPAVEIEIAAWLTQRGWRLVRPRRARANHYGHSWQINFSSEEAELSGWEDFATFRELEMWTRGYGSAESDHYPNTDYPQRYGKENLARTVQFHPWLAGGKGEATQ